MANDKNYMKVERAELENAISELVTAVEQMEKATDDILNHAEALGEGLSQESPDLTALQDKANALFELCSFQDIAGQRITKAKNLLERIAGHAEAQKTDARKAQEASGLLGGPSAEGEGMSQGDVDKLMSKD